MSSHASTAGAGSETLLDQHDGRQHATVTAETRGTLVPVSVIIPTYNEAECIEETINRCRSALDAHPSEVLIVDDDSPDRTWQLVRTAYPNAEDVQVIRRVGESGLASAVTRGFEEASHPFCVVMDGDLQHPPERVPDLLAAFDDGIDIVVGSRYTAGAGIENWSSWRRAVSVGAQTIAKVLLPQARGLSDPMSGFFAVRQPVVENVDLSPTGYKILLEVLVKGEYRGVAEVPYEFSARYRGDSKLTTSEYLNFLKHVGALRGGATVE